MNRKQSGNFTTKKGHCQPFLHLFHHDTFSCAPYFYWLIVIIFFKICSPPVKKSCRFPWHRIFQRLFERKKISTKVQKPRTEVIFLSLKEIWYNIPLIEILSQQNGKKCRRRIWPHDGSGVRQGTRLISALFYKHIVHFLLCCCMYNFL